MIDKKLGQIDQITIQISNITERLTSIEKKCEEIETSQSFLAANYETMSKTAEDNKREIIRIKHDLKTLTSENVNLKQNLLSISNVDI
ncbi:hypothetical protein DPMN_101154 [Dreissena polymorpha]|uniref:Uncharacterized protein n=1 Tax=Dreissena polymorpha TaxID=45954 RepID=A0A9D4LIX1_DREPO|nr:hypothetical protein DPMN_101154 [Dreissena polymorpha]